jgi:hypothetical protein
VCECVQGRGLDKSANTSVDVKQGDLYTNLDTSTVCVLVIPLMATANGYHANGSVSVPVVEPVATAVSERAIYSHSL